MRLAQLCSFHLQLGHFDLYFPHDWLWLSFALRFSSRILHAACQWYFISRCPLQTDAASTCNWVILTYIFRMNESGTVLLKSPVLGYYIEYINDISSVDALCSTKAFTATTGEGISCRFRLLHQFILLVLSLVSILKLTISSKFRY